MKDALSAALDCDPVDAVNDAELLAIVLWHWANQINAAAISGHDAQQVIYRTGYYVG